MSRREFIPPGRQKLSGTVVDDDVVFRLIGNHDQAAAFIHYHLMTVLYGRRRRIQVSPGLMNAVTEISVTDDLLAHCGFTDNVEHRQCESCTRGSSDLQKITSGMRRFFHRIYGSVKSPFEMTGSVILFSRSC